MVLCCCRLLMVYYQTTHQGSLTNSNTFWRHTISFTPVIGSSVLHVNGGNRATVGSEMYTHVPLSYRYILHDFIRCSLIRTSTLMSNLCSWGRKRGTLRTQFSAVMSSWSCSPVFVLPHSIDREREGKNKRREQTKRKGGGKKPLFSTRWVSAFS